MEHAPFRRFVTVPILEAPFTDNPSPCTSIRLPRTSDSAKLDSSAYTGSQIILSRCCSLSLTSMSEEPGMGAARETVMKCSSRLCPLPPSVFSSLEWGGGRGERVRVDLDRQKAETQGRHERFETLTYDSVSVSLLINVRARLLHMALTLLPLTGPRVISRGSSLVGVVRSPHRHVLQRRLRSPIRAMAQRTDYDIFVIGKITSIFLDKCVLTS